MAEITVEVAGRAYRMGCGEGEEAHLGGLAAMLDAEARTLTRQFGQMPEGRLLLMTALMVADRLADLESQLRAADERADELKRLAERRSQPADMFGPEREESLARRINLLVAQIERAAGDPDD